MTTEKTTSAPAGTNKKGSSETRDKYSRKEVFMVPPEDLTIVLEPTHRLYDERATLPLDPRMVDNVDALGIKENVIVERVDGKLLIKDGRQRQRWATAVNAKRAAEKPPREPMKVPCTFDKPGDDSTATMISLNEVRQQDDIIVKARKAQRYLAQLQSEGGADGKSAPLSLKEAEKRCALVFATKVGTVRNWLKLLELGPAIQAQVSAGTISYVGALTTAELPKEDQAKVAADIAATAAAAPKKEGHHVAGKGSKPKVQVSIKDVAAKVADQAKKAGVTVSVSKVHDKVQYGVAPKRGAIRKAMAKAAEMKATMVTHVAGAVLAWALGDVESRKAEMAELGDDVKEALRAIFKAGKPKEEGKE